MKQVFYLASTKPVVNDATVHKVTMVHDLSLNRILKVIHTHGAECCVFGNNSDHTANSTHYSKH